jgi:hypothetical protein
LERKLDSLEKISVYNKNIDAAKIRLKEFDLKCDSIRKKYGKKSENLYRLNQITYENLIKKYGISDAQKILEHKVWIGMTKEQLIESWGNPKKFNTSNYGNGNEYQYVYENQYIYLKGNPLIVIAYN